MIIANWRKFTNRRESYLQSETAGKIMDNPIPKVTSSVLMNLRHRQTHDLSYLHKSLSYDDDDAFAQSAQKSHIRLHVLADALYGYMTWRSPAESDLSTSQQLEHILLENIGNASTTIDSFCYLYS